MEYGEEIFRKLDPVVREVIEQQFIPQAFVLREGIERSEPYHTLQERVLQLKKAYVDAATALVVKETHAKNISYAQAVTRSAILESPDSTLFNGLQRAVEVACEGLSTSKKTALTVFDAELRYLLREKLPPGVQHNL